MLFGKLQLKNQLLNNSLFWLHQLLDYDFFYKDGGLFTNDHIDKCPDFMKIFKK